MLKKDQVVAMATALKMDIAEFTASYDATEEKEIKLPEGISVFTAAELISREETLKSGGIKAGREIAIKELKTEAGLEYDGEGSKDFKRFLTEYGKKVKADSSIDESTKVKELNTTIEGLRINITQMQADSATQLAATRQAQLDSEILTMTIDKKPDNLTNAEWVTIIKMNNSIEEVDGVKTVKRDGKTIVDPVTLKSIAVKDALTAYIDERKLGKVITTTTTTGRNGQDSRIPLTGIANMKQFKQHLAEQGINANGEKAQALLAEVTKDNPQFDFKDS